MAEVSSVHESLNCKTSLTVRRFFCYTPLPGQAGNTRHHARTETAGRVPEEFLQPIGAQSHAR